VTEAATAASWFPSRLRERDREEGKPQTPEPGAALLPTLCQYARAGLVRTRAPYFAIAGVLAIIGLVLFGQGAWIRAKAVLAQILLQRAFAQTLVTGQAIKPWPWADTWPVARIEVPRLNKRAIVLDGTSGQALAFGPGHVAASSDAGEPGTAIYAAHRDTHFAFLADIAVGDEIRVRRRDGALVRFRVTGMGVVRWDASGIDPLAPGRNLVLSTCWPLDAQTSGPLRYVVHATIIDEASML
jgi:sortase A